MKTISRKPKITIGDVSISIEGDDCRIWPGYRPFIGAGETDITLRLCRGATHLPEGEMVFDCSPIWTLYRRNGTSIIRIFADRQFSGLERILVFPRSVERADLYFVDHATSFIDPFYGPTMELLMMSYLGQGRGVILHSCGISMNGEGILFVGESGAGKSTIARIWGQRTGVEVLSDDRIIVRRKGGQFWMYGTPWHGDARFASPRRARLERIYFLRSGQMNSARKVKGGDSVSGLLKCSFVAHWHSDAMGFALEMFSDLTTRIPCQELTYKRDGNALDLIERVTT